MIICADDYGLREDINLAILELCSLKRLSAVSCMAALADCNSVWFSRLREHEVDIGLHLCLADSTLPAPGLSAQGDSARRLPSFATYLRRALLGGVSPRDVARHVADQYELFVQKCGRVPDFIDGHLHAHQLTGARQGLLAFVQSLAGERRPYVRNTRHPLSELRRLGLPWGKAALIGCFGAAMFSELRTAGVPTNEGFAGIYDFRKWRRYPAYFPKFADCLGNANGILVVHPGEREEWRRQEFETLRGASVVPNRFKTG